MTRQIFRNLALSLTLLGVAFSASLSSAQGGLAAKLPGAREASPRSPAASHQKQTPGSPSYTYTLLSFPATLSTLVTGINPGATTAKTYVVGGYGPDVDFTEGGFLVLLSRTKTISETYEAVNYPHIPKNQIAADVNDLGQVVGTYVDSSGVGHGYVWSGGKFTTLNVPFAGATGTFPQGINNSDEVVGCWDDSAENSHGFTLIGSTYASFDYPGGSQTCGFDVNNAGNIVGSYQDASGVYNGYLLSGGTYTSFAVPGAVETSASGLNDVGDIVGSYQDASGVYNGYLLSGGVFTTIALPGEVYTILTDISNNGVVVGYYQDAAGLIVSFLATP